MIRTRVRHARTVRHDGCRPYTETTCVHPGAACPTDSMGDFQR
ncbi:hypothetical protein NSERUTF1_1098 [Nocardia seriolae]|nr:hypothetical protein NSERUTF1_1098 [Nocardia seriolae]